MKYSNVFSAAYNEEFIAIRVGTYDFKSEEDNEEIVEEDVKDIHEFSVKPEKIKGLIGFLLSIGNEYQKQYGNIGLNFDDKAED